MGKNEGEWAKAFFSQSKEDYIAAKRLMPSLEHESEIIAPSVFVMLIQMVVEKIGKAACLHSGRIGDDYKRHAISTRFLQILVRTGEDDKISNIHDIKRILKEIENAHPSWDENHQQLEYPWRMRNGTIGYPAKDLPIAQRMRDPEHPDIKKLIKFIDWLFKNYDSLFY